MRKEFNKDVDPVLLSSTRRRQSQNNFKFNGLSSESPNTNIYNKSPNKRISRFSNSMSKNPSVSLNRSQPKQFKSSNKNKSGIFFDEQSSPHLELIETFKSLLDMGIPQAKFFLKKEILNCEEKNEKFNLDKILKVNYFCEEVETMSITIQNFRNSILRSSTNQPLQGESDDGTAPYKENIVDNINTNVLRMASERRISVYQNLFEDMKKTFDDVIKISNYEINHNRSTQILIDLIEEDNDSNRDDNKFINIDCIKPFFSGKSRKRHSGKELEVINSRRSCIDKSSSSNKSSHDSGTDTIRSLKNESSCFNSMDNNSLSEGIIEQIYLPISRIRKVSIEDEFMTRQGHIRKNTMKDVLVYEKGIRTRIKTYLERQNRFLTSSKSSSMSEKDNNEMEKNKIDNNLKLESLAR